jgi:hypothetical protein
MIGVFDMRASKRFSTDLLFYLFFLCFCNASYAQAFNYNNEQIELNILKKIDGSRDGRVSMEEWTLYKSKQFQSLDRNSDGLYTAADIPEIFSEDQKKALIVEIRKIGGSDEAVSQSEYIEASLDEYEKYKSH